MSAAAPIVAVKLGGSLITDKRRDRTDRPEVIARLARELAEARATDRPPRILLGHGSGSFGHVAAARHRIAEGVSDPAQLLGIPETQAAAAELHRRVVSALDAAGALPFSIAPSSSLIAEAGEPVAFDPEPVALALRLGLLPVVFGDVVLDRRQGVAICSTETMLLQLTRSLPATEPIRRVLWLGETDGVLDADGRVIPEVRRDAGGLEAVGEAAGTDVTGGMRHRIETALALAELGAESWILYGRVPGRLAAALRGEEVPATRVPAVAG